MFSSLELSLRFTMMVCKWLMRRRPYQLHIQIFHANTHLESDVIYNDHKVTSAGVPTNAPVAPAAIPRPAFMKNPEDKAEEN